MTKIKPHSQIIAAGIHCKYSSFNFLSENEIFISGGLDNLEMTNVNGLPNTYI